MNVPQAANGEWENLALQRAAEGKKWRTIAAELQGRGMEKQDAAIMAQHATRIPGWYHREWFAVGLGLLMMMAAGGIFFAANGGIVAYGLFIVGLFRLVTGLSKK
jgi:hypothetical protein